MTFDGQIFYLKWLFLISPVIALNIIYSHVSICRENRVLTMTNPILIRWYVIYVSSDSTALTHWESIKRNIIICKKYLLTWSCDETVKEPFFRYHWPKWLVVFAYLPAFRTYFSNILDVSIRLMKSKFNLLMDRDGSSIMRFQADLTYNPNRVFANLFVSNVQNVNTK
jgi:hypothetical protein